MTMLRRPLVAISILLMLVAGCSKKPDAAPGSTSETASSPAAGSASSGLMVSEEMIKPWQGDFDGMAERRVIRALVVHSKMFYSIDRGQEHGVSYDALKAFEADVNKRLGATTLKVNVAFIPVPRDQLLPALLAGRGDIAAANLTITSTRQQSVDFSDAFLTNVSEVVVTGPGAPSLTSVDDLSGKEVQVRPSSSYYEGLVRLNDKFKQAGKPLMKLTPADELLEDEDLLEMTNAGILPITVVDSHKAEFWKQIFDKITVHKDLAVNTGGQIAWAMRKNSPKLLEAVNAFVKDHRQGSMFGNMVLKRYLSSADYIKNSTSEEELKKFTAVVDLFKRYAGEYDFDWLMVAAQAYQESRIDQGVRSSVGAVGIMQIKPDTASDPNVNIPNVEKMEDNIHAGIKYLRFVTDHYFKDAQMDKVNKQLFAFASYNAGPAKIARLRKDAATMGLDPNKWFGNVEVVAAREIGRETVQYVSNIYKYYVAYRQVTALNERAKRARS